ncbi:FimB/Mfa2 family fimbrial subunit [Muribaculum intestinale]|uniref:FimB/Mfa2 family fimbrial subunit n=2 Tax=Muribaculum intestinale TaxID=1796646 RepID=UPI0025A946B2|nr:FimB/Mfa2 family fimbrial subunit [Muribaculum intestinale]
MPRLSKYIIAACSMAAAMLAASCTMIQDSVDYCPTGLYVRFVYDYNTARADMFKDHVGHVRLYVYDEQGQKVAERSVSNTAASAPLADYGYALHLDPSELRPGRYRLQAVAMQRDWDAAAAADGARYRHEADVTHGEAMRITLDHDPGVIPGTQQHLVDHKSLPLDTLWHTLKVQSHAPTDGVAPMPMQRTSRPYSVYPLDEQYVTVTDNMATYATISLVRDTKHLNITMRHLDFPDDVFHHDYEVTIVDDNATLLHDNALAPSDSLRYTPYAAWTSRFTDGGVIVDPTVPRATSQADDDAPDGLRYQRTAHYNLMFNRLMYNDDAARSAMLQVRNLNSGKVVARINLPYMLAEGRAAYELYGYSPQEYLDREYDYHLNLFLKGESWAYCDIVVNVLSWSKRHQNEEL